MQRKCWQDTNAVLPSRISMTSRSAILSKALRKSKWQENFDPNYAVSIFKTKNTAITKNNKEPKNTEHKSHNTTNPPTPQINSPTTKKTPSTHTLAHLTPPPT